MSGYLLGIPKFLTHDSNGVPLEGGKLYSYHVGTDTPKSTYSDVSCSVANTNPVVLDSRGEASIYLNGATKLILTGPDDDPTTPIWTWATAGSPADGISTNSFKDYGAIGNGTTDDTAAIQAAVNAGGSLYAGPGTYKITSPINITVAGTTISGPGEIVQTTSITPYVGLWVTVDDVTIDGLTLTGASLGDESSLPGSIGCGIGLYRVSNGVVRNCTITGWGSAAGAGVWVTGSTNCTVRDCIFDDCLYGYNDDDWGHADATPHLSIGNKCLGNIITNSRATGIAIDYAASAATTNWSYGFEISHNTVSDSALYLGGFGDGIAFVNCRGGGNCNSNICYGNAGNGIEIKGNSQNINVGNNFCYNNNHGLYIWEGGAPYAGLDPLNIAITGGQYYANTLDGIHGVVALNINCTGAAVFQNGQYGIFLNNIIGGEFTGNVITYNGKHGFYNSSCRNINVVGGQIAGNGTAASDTYAGFYGDEDGVSYTNISINLSGINFCTSTFPTQTQKYAIQLVGNTSGIKCSVMNCSMEDALTAPYLNDAAGWFGVVFENNLPKVQTILYGSGTVDTDISKGQVAYIDVAANAALTISNPTNPAYYQRLTYNILKAANALTITWGSAFKAGTTAVNASKQVQIEFLFDGNYHRQVGTPIETTP